MIYYINTGTSANSGNGDSIRTAFNKINQNFLSLSGQPITTATTNVFVTNVASTSTGTLVYSTPGTTRSVQLLVAIEAPVSGFVEAQTGNIVIGRSSKPNVVSASTYGMSFTSDQLLASLAVHVNTTTSATELYAIPRGISSGTHVVKVDVVASISA